MYDTAFQTFEEKYCGQSPSCFTCLVIIRVIIRSIQSDDWTDHASGALQGPDTRISDRRSETSVHDSEHEEQGATRVPVEESVVRVTGVPGSCPVLCRLQVEDYAHQTVENITPVWDITQCCTHNQMLGKVTKLDIYLTQC